MAEITITNPTIKAGYAAFVPPNARPAGFARFAGAWTPAGVSPMRTPAGASFGFRSGNPAESLPLAGNARYSDAHEIKFIFWAAAGINTISLPAQLTVAADVSPVLSIQANTVLAIAAAQASINPALITQQTLTLSFTAAAAGRALLVLSWRSRVYTGAVEYGPLTVS